MIPTRLIIIGALVGLLLTATAIGFVLVNKANDRAAKEAERAGAAIQRETNLNQTISNAERANNAAENIKRDPAAVNDDCLRNARNPADC